MSKCLLSFESIEISSRDWTMLTTFSDEELISSYFANIYVQLVRQEQAKLPTLHDKKHLKQLILNTKLITDIHVPLTIEQFKGLHPHIPQNFQKYWNTTLYLHILLESGKVTTSDVMK